MDIDSPIVKASRHDATFPTMAPCCADCAAPVSGRYCAGCGQETLIETPTIRHFLQEFVDQYVALEGKLGRTLKVLVLKPGQLTLDYVEGRRQRYVRPLKLYLSISVIFFTLLGVLPDSSNPFLNDADKGGNEKGINLDFSKKKKGEAEAPAVKKEGQAADAAADDETKDSDGDKPETGSFERAVKGKVTAFSKLSAAEQRHAVREKLADEAPYAMFFLLPYFALLLRLFYRKQKLRYGVHLLFSLHLHSFLFIVLAIGFIPLPSIMSTALEIGIGAYVFLALRHVYGGTPFQTLWRMCWLWLFYIMAVAASAASGVLSAVFNGSAA